MQYEPDNLISTIEDLPKPSAAETASLSELWNDDLIKIFGKQMMGQSQTTLQHQAPLKQKLDPLFSLMEDSAPPAKKMFKSAPKKETSLANLPPMPMKSQEIKKLDCGPITNTTTQVKIGDKIYTIIQKGNGISSLQNIEDASTAASAQTSAPTSKPPSQMDHDYFSDKKFNLINGAKSMVGTAGISPGIGPGLKLTEEEKKLLEMEDVVIPEDMPLTKNEENTLKKVRRKIKNKQSAMESRRRRKDYIENLELRVKHCTDQNGELKRKVDRLSEDNKTLLSQLKTLQSLVATSVQQSRSQTGTCLAVFMLAFAFFVLPFNPMGWDSKALVQIRGSGGDPTPATSFKSRTLLSAAEHSHPHQHDLMQDALNDHLNNHGSIRDVMQENESNIYGISGTLVKQRGEMEEMMGDNSDHPAFASYEKNLKSLDHPEPMEEYTAEVRAKIEQMLLRDDHHGDHHLGNVLAPSSHYGIISNGDVTAMESTAADQRSIQPLCNDTNGD